jgi:DNA-binding MarR family transcriptional regulator
VDVLDALTSWTPRERQGAFRSWLRGSLSLVHLHVLTILEDGPLPMSRLADALDVSVASATGIVDRMEGRKLVERLSDPADRRVVLVHATRRGTAVFGALTRERRARLRPILERMSDDELASFLTGLRAMRRIRAELHESGTGH